MIESRIKQFMLELSHLSIEEQEDMRQQIVGDISSVIKSLVSSAISELQDLGVEDAITHLELSGVSGYPELRSDTGNFDFSTPPTPMLPWLLKNAKVAKDGTLYKRIPIGGGGSKEKRTKDISSGIDRMNSISPMEDMASEMAASFNAGATPIKKMVEKQGGEVHFRTATSKQDPSKDWVLPSKEQNLSFQVQAINQRLRADIDLEVEAIIRGYRRRV